MADIPYWNCSTKSTACCDRTCPRKTFFDNLQALPSTYICATYLRLLGFDALHHNHYHDTELAQISSEEQRILLAQDQGLLKCSVVTYRYVVRPHHPKQQARAVLERFSLQDAVARWNATLAVTDGSP
nr:Mut7-C RNAse domain-containing protein [Pseudanabaena sp. FACHB-2040]